MRKVYASFDVEADGPCPYNSNMVELGISFLDEFGEEVDYFYSTIKQREGKSGDADTIEWLKKNDVYDRAITSSAPHPKEVFNNLVNKLKELSLKYEISWVSHPAAYDWQWLKNYWVEFVAEEDQKLLTYYSICLDSIFDFYAIEKGLTREEKKKLWNKLKKEGEHTHNALDDAREQGNVFVELMRMINEN